MADRQTKTIQWTINLPMDFPSDWDDDMIEFHLNESSWCCSNLISKLEKYDEKNGCICGICEAKELSKLPSEMGFVRKSDVMQILGSQKCAYNIKEEKNKTLDEVLKACDIECGLYSGDVKNLTRHVLMRVLDRLRE